MIKLFKRFLFKYLLRREFYGSYYGCVISARGKKITLKAKNKEHVQLTLQHMAKGVGLPVHE